jgi:hypothetical protein
MQSPGTTPGAATTDRRIGPRRGIGAIGTTARILVGLAMVGSVLTGHLIGDFRPDPWLLGLIGFPAAVLAWRGSQAPRAPPRLRATGPLAVVVNIAVVAALYATPWYAPSVSVTSDAALLFYGTSMLLAAARGYAGCEVLAISNWVLHRDDQIGCLVFSPLDRLERRLQRRPTAARPATTGEDAA